MTETSEEDVVAKLDMIRADLRWLQSRCAVLPAVAKIDPPDEVIRFRREAGVDSSMIFSPRMDQVAF